MGFAIVLVLAAAGVASCRLANPGTEAAISAPLATAESIAPTATAAPSPTTEPTQEATPSAVTPSASPTPELSDTERSDYFWDRVMSLHTDRFYETQRGILADSDLVVVGRVSESRPGEEYSEDMPPGYPDPTLKFLYVTLAIESVLHGTPETSVPGTVDIRLLGDHSELEPFITEHRLLLFLKNGAEVLREEGQPLEEQELWRLVYLPLGPGGLIRDIDGLARAQREFADCCPDFFPANIDGSSFDAVVEGVADGT